MAHAADGRAGPGQDAPGGTNVAIEDGLTDTDRVLSKFLVKENNARVRYLTDEEARRLREAIGEVET